jgi:DNA-binding response OmpR family regulator
MTATAIATARILVVEDELLVRLFAVDALEDAGFKVDEAGSAAEALAKLGDGGQGIRAAVVDLGLPDRAGDQLAAEMHALRADLAIVIASGRSERELNERFQGNRRIAVLGKPYTAYMLIEALASLGINPAAQ